MVTARKKVYIAYAGGTIGMTRTDQGYAPRSGYLQHLMEQMPEFRHPDFPRFEIHESSPLLDSANASPEDWITLAEDICNRYDDYDGFVVLHGTDTMAYTASALSFILDGLSKPVLVTGSQIPLCEIRTDARDNLIGALQIAGTEGIPEVCLYFHNRVFRGNRSVKVHADGLGAFESPNYPALGWAGVEIEINRQVVREAGTWSGPEIPDFDGKTVGALRLFPGISSKLVRNTLRPPLNGLVLEAFGVGNAPDRPDFLEVLGEATLRGVVVVDCTQCLRGTVRLRDYATGSSLADAGVISGFDMTAEAALTKLHYLLSVEDSVDQVRRMMMTDLRGELTC